MSEEKNKFDELFRNQFENVELPVSDRVLKQIKEELNIPEKKRRGGFWFWSLLGFVFFISAIGIYFFVESDKNLDVKNKQVVAENSVSGKARNSNKIGKDKPVQQNPERENKENGTAQNNTKHDQNPSAEIVPQAKTKVEPVVSATIKNAENYTAKKEVKEKNINVKESLARAQPKVITSSKTKSHSKELKETTKPEHNSNGHKDEGKSLSASEQGKQSTKKKVKENVREKKDQEKIVNLKETKFAEPLVNKAPASDSEKKSEVDKSTKESGLAIPDDIAVAEEKRQQESGKTAVSQKSDNVFLKKDTVALADNKGKADSIVNGSNTLEKGIKEAKNITFFVDVAGGPSIAYRSLSVSQNSFFTDKNKYETNRLSYNAGLDVGAIVKEKYVVSIGFGIDTKGERYSFSGQEAKYHEFTDTSWTPVYDSSGNVLYYDTTLTIGTSQTQAAAAAKKASNTYQFIRIPVMFGYRFTLGNKWFITPNVGVIINYMYKANASWFDSDQQRYVYYTNKSSVFSLITVAARVKFDIGFNITNKWSVLLQPGYVRFMQPIYRKEESFKQYPYSYDCNLAIRYHF
jgi:hypothetical protein